MLSVNQLQSRFNQDMDWECIRKHRSQFLSRPKFRTILSTDTDFTITSVDRRCKIDHNLGEVIRGWNLLRFWHLFIDLITTSRSNEITWTQDGKNQVNEDAGKDLDTIGLANDIETQLVCMQIDLVYHRNMWYHSGYLEFKISRSIFFAVKIFITIVMHKCQVTEKKSGNRYQIWSLIWLNA